MNPREKINKEIVNVIGCIKDNVSNDLIKASKDGTIPLEEVQLRKILGLIGPIIDAAYYRSNPSLMRSVDAALKVAAEKKA